MVNNFNEYSKVLDASKSIYSYICHIVMPIVVVFIIKYCYLGS